MTAEEILTRLKALKKYEVTKYKSNHKKEVLEYETCQDFGRFILSSDIYWLIKDIEKAEPNS